MFKLDKLSTFHYTNMKTRVDGTKWDQEIATCVVTQQAKCHLADLDNSKNGPTNIWVWKIGPFKIKYVLLLTFRRSAKYHIIFTIRIREIKEICRD